MWVPKADQFEMHADLINMYLATIERNILLWDTRQLYDFVRTCQIWELLTLCLITRMRNTCLHLSKMDGADNHGSNACSSKIFLYKRRLLLFEFLNNGWTGHTCSRKDKCRVVCAIMVCRSIILGSKIDKLQPHLTVSLKWFQTL